MFQQVNALTGLQCRQVGIHCSGGRELTLLGATPIGATLHKATDVTVTVLSMRLWIRGCSLQRLALTRLLPYLAARRLTRLRPLGV